MKQNQPVRKPLRQRVADRKRGIKEVKPSSERTKKFMKYLKLFLATIQYLGLGLLLLSLGAIVNNAYVVNDWNLIVVYSAMFIIGRGGLTVISTVGQFK